MRVLHAYQEMLSKGGRPDDSRSLISAISALGHRAAAVTCPPSNDTPPIRPAAGVEVFEVPRGFRSVAEFRQALDAFQPDVVHFTGGPRIPLQVLWAREVRTRGIPYVVSACGNLSPDTFRYRWGMKKNRFYHPLAKRLFHRLFDRPLLRRAAAVHAGSPSERDLALDAGATSVFVAPFGVKKEWLGAPHARRKAHDPVTFTYLGRLSIQHKALDVIVEAFGKVVEAGHGDRCRLVLAGTDENGSMQELRERARALKISNISLPGGIWGDAKQVLWDDSDYFLHLCRYNGFALSVREAVGQGLPILTTLESDLGDWARSHGMGSVVEVSRGSLADAIIDSLDRSADAYAAMSTNARAFAEMTVWSAVADTIVKAYRDHSASALRSVGPFAGISSELFPNEQTVDVAV